jgi:hypothetical protein
MALAPPVNGIGFGGNFIRYGFITTQVSDQCKFRLTFARGQAYHLGIGKRLLLGGAAMVAVRESRSDTRTVIYGFLVGALAVLTA